jgi:hypothetical protein
MAESDSMMTEFRQLAQGGGVTIRGNRIHRYSHSMQLSTQDLSTIRDAIDDPPPSPSLTLSHTEKAATPLVDEMPLGEKDSSDSMVKELHTLAQGGVTLRGEHIHRYSRSMQMSHVDILNLREAWNDSQRPPSPSE